MGIRGRHPLFAWLCSGDHCVLIYGPGITELASSGWEFTFTLLGFAVAIVLIALR